MVPFLCSFSPVVRARLPVHVRRGLPTALAAALVAAVASSAAGQTNPIPAILAGSQHPTVTASDPIPVFDPQIDRDAASPDKPFSAFSRSALTLRDSVVALVRAQLGRRYRHGGTTPEHGFDCSGLVKYVMSALSIELPRTARLQARSGFKVPRDTTALQPGDLLTFGNGAVSHIGIYVGDGHFVHASSVAGKVIESRVNRPLVARVKPWRGARRVITPDDSTAG
jgi:cell wall-associated NlpC family hydrolase